MAETYPAMSANAFPESHWEQNVPYQEDTYTPTESRQSNRRATPETGIRKPGDTKRKDSLSGRATFAQFEAVAPQQKRPSNVELTEGVAEDAAWIHRDKLAQIESREMAEAGFRVRRPSTRRKDGEFSRSGSLSGSRPTSRSSSRKTKSRDRTDHDPAMKMDPDYRSNELRTFSRNEGQTGSEFDEDGFQMENYEHRPGPPPQQYSRQLQRPSSSRIPVSRHSPSPMPNSFGSFRDRAGSEMWTNRAIETTEDGPPRSQSVGANALMNSHARPQTPTRSYEQSNQQFYTPLTSSGRNTTPMRQGSRNGYGFDSSPASASKGSGHKARQDSADYPKRQGSRTLNRPEGEAPWLADMFKPDPMLPPEKQMLPTHAKRKAQEQMERGESVDLTNLSNGLSPNNPRPERNSASEKCVVQPEDSYEVSPIERPPMDQHASWPLDDRVDAQGPIGSKRSSQRGSGYKITPTVAPTAQTTISSQQRPQQEQEYLHPATLRAREMSEKDEKKAGCTCCIVM